MLIQTKERVDLTIHLTQEEAENIVFGDTDELIALIEDHLPPVDEDDADTPTVKRGRKPRKSTKRKEAGKVSCPQCGKACIARGLNTHIARAHKEKTNG